MNMQKILVVARAVLWRRLKEVTLFSREHDIVTKGPINGLRVGRICLVEETGDHLRQALKTSKESERRQ